MASTYSTLKIELIGTGEQSGTWGTTTNTNLGTAIEEAIVGSADVSFSSADVTLTLTDTNAAQTARNLRLNLTGTSGGARNLILGSGCQIDKPYLINNGLADTVTVKNTTGTGIAVPAGKTMWVYNNGTNVVDAVTHLSSLTLGTALPIASGGTGSTSTTFVNLTTNVTGTLPILNGGTGATTDSGARTALGATTVGSNFFTLTNPSAIRFTRINADNSVSALSDSDFRTAIGAGTGSGTVTSVAVSGGTTGLTTSGGPITSSGTITIAGTLAVANGGTGQTSYTDGQLLIGNSTGNTLAKATLTAGTGISVTNGSGTITVAATNNGTVTSVAVSGGTTGLTTSGGPITSSGTITIAGTLAATNGGTGITSLGTGIATWLGTPSSANLASAVTDETGSGLLVFGTTPVITGLREKSAAVAASDIDLSLGNYFTKTISGTTTFTVSNVATSGDVAAFILILTNGGSATVNWFSGVTWNNATPPTLTASGIDILGFFTINGGTTWRGLVLAQAVA